MKFLTFVCLSAAAVAAFSVKVQWSSMDRSIGKDLLPTNKRGHVIRKGGLKEYRPNKSEIMLVKRRQLECIEEVRVDPDLVHNVRSGLWKKRPDPLLKEWALCCLMKAGLMTRQGVYKIDVALSKVPKEAAVYVERLIDHCLSQKAIPAVDIAYNFASCYDKYETNYTLVSIL